MKEEKMENQIKKGIGEKLQEARFKLENMHIKKTGVHKEKGIELFRYYNYYFY
jgi:hypothetical protein